MTKRLVPPNTIKDQRRNEKRLDVLESRDVQGTGGAGDLSFTYIQGAASDVWTIPHALNKYPVPTVETDEGGGVRKVRQVNWEHVDSNTMKIYFGRAFSGRAYLN